MLEHLIIVGVQLYAPWLEVLFRPCKFLGVWREGGDEFGLRCAVEEVICVSGAHAAKAGDSDLEAADLRHCGV